MMRLRNLGSILLTSLSVAGCFQVFDTSEMRNDGPVVCATSAGYYHLPRKIIKLTAETTGSRGFKLDFGASRSIADAAHRYCLEFLTYANTQDQIVVRRSAEGLLERVYAHVEDKSVEIIKRVIDTAAQAAIAARGLTVAEGTDKAELEIDPFDQFQLSEANRTLRRFGLCLYIEGHSFDASAVSPAKWCEDARRWRHAPGPSAIVAALPVPDSAQRIGILYRPNLAHNLVVMRKLDPRGPDRWVLYKTQRVEMPNASPVYAIRVERALFTKRETNLDFVEGVLTNVRVKKESELKAFVDIPLYLAQAIAALPAQIVQVRIADANNEIALLQAEERLFQARKEYQDAVNARVAAAQGAAPLPGDGRSAPAADDETSRRAAEAAADPRFRERFVAACRDAGTPEPGCSEQWRRYFSR